MTNPMTFTVTEDHIKLLERMYIENYDDVPKVNPKRPYGNSDVLRDVAEILGWELIEDRYGEMVMTREQGDRAEKLHKQMADVLQILVHNPTNFSVGTYKNISSGAPYSILYRKVEK